MFSDSCFELIEKLLEEIKDYDYSDDYMDELILIIRTLNEIRDDLDHCSINNEVNSTADTNNLLRNNKAKSIKIALKMYMDAQKKRVNYPMTQ